MEVHMLFAMRLLYGVMDLFDAPKHPLYIDPKRINDEDRAVRRRALDDDVEYRGRVKKRMMEGLTSKQMPPLINRSAVLKRRRRNPNVVHFTGGRNGTTTAKS